MSKLMIDLEKQLHRLSKIEPQPKFCREAKKRLMHQIILDSNEKWFLRLFKKVFSITPHPYFIQTARIRLMEQIEAMKRPIFGWWVLFKRLAASTLVMAIAVTAVLFFVDGKQLVSASENTYLEVFNGNVTVKHADQLIWDPVIQHTELSAGDLVRLDETASATIHFFDDSEMRLTGDSLFLISRLDVSPSYARQGVIEVSLHEGKAWVQTLNADDGFAGFTLITRDAILSSRNASFDVQTNLLEPTTLRVFRHGVDMHVLREESRNVFTSGRVNSYQQIMIEATSSTQPTLELSAYAPIADLTEDDRNEPWVVENLETDRTHLAELRKRELVNLRTATGTLPGHVLYPLKRAKERLNLALRFGEESQINTQIKMANERLSEAIVLIEQGETEKAKLALMEYQNLVRQIAEENADETVDLDQLSTQIVATHQKTLFAALPGDAQIGIVKQVLNQAEELFAENPAKKTEIRLQNSLEDLTHVQDLVLAGNLEGAQELLANHEISASVLLEEASELEDEEQKKMLFKQILETQYEEKRLLGEIKRELSRQSTENPLSDLVASTEQNLKEEIKHTAAVVRPLIPDVVLSHAVILPEQEKLLEFVEKINIYSTWQGQKNQISRLLTQYPQYARDIDFLIKVRDRLDTRAKDILNTHILQMQRKLAEAKGRAVQLKINRAIRLRER